MSTIALLSDFGLRDWFVADLKGAILSIAPSSTLVDITHEIKPGDLRSAAFVLHSCVNSFPKWTIFCIAIDPGSNRNCPVMVVRTEKHIFVSPDNGILSWVLPEQEHYKCHICSNNSFFRTTDPTTFRGRDIIAPVSAHCTTGLPLEQFGPAHVPQNRLEFPFAKFDKGTLSSSIIYIDHFGNLITGIKNEMLNMEHSSEISVSIGKHDITIPVQQFYDQVQSGRFLIYMGSAGFIEIAANGEDVSKILNVTIGDQVTINFKAD